MQLANQEAQRLNHEYIGTEHVLLGIVKAGNSIAASVLKSANVSLGYLRDAVLSLIKPGPDMVTLGKLPLTPNAKKVIEYAIEEAKGLGPNHVGTEHMLLGCLRVEDGIASVVLRERGLTLAGLRAEIATVVTSADEFAEKCLGMAEVFDRLRASSRAHNAGPELLALWQAFFAAQDEFTRLFLSGQMKSDATDDAMHKRDDVLRMARQLVKKLTEG
jgi:ATP-dependent Clp protease ATP-binding subunit ClpA